MCTQERGGGKRKNVNLQLVSRMDQRCKPDSWLVVDDGAVDPVNPDILDITLLGSEVRPSDCDLCPPKLWAGLWIEL